MNKLNQIASDASNLYKSVSKKEAFSIVQAMIVSGEQLTDTDMSKLYRHFMPSIPATPKTAFDWVYKAVSNKDVRNYLNWLYCDGSRLCGIDGHRLHIHTLPENHSYSVGWYDKAGIKVDDKGTYPQIDRVIPTVKRSDDARMLTVSELSVVHVADKIQAFDLGNGCHVNRKYLLDTIGKAKTFIVENYADLDGVKQSVLINHEHGNAVIMPIKVD